MLFTLQTTCFITFFSIRYEMSLTSHIPKSDNMYEKETHKLNTELQIALLKWKINSIQKKTSFQF